MVFDQLIVCSFTIRLITKLYFEAHRVNHCWIIADREKNSLVITRETVTAIVTFLNLAIRCSPRITHPSLRGGCVNFIDFFSLFVWRNNTKFMLNKWSHFFSPCGMRMYTAYYAREIIGISFHLLKHIWVNTKALSKYLNNGLKHCGFVIFSLSFHSHVYVTNTNVWWSIKILSCLKAKYRNAVFSRLESVVLLKQSYKNKCIQHARCAYIDFVLK